MSQTDRKTWFAPAERSSTEEIERKLGALETARVPLGIFDCLPTLTMVLDENRQVVLANRAVHEHFQNRGAHLEPGARLGEALGCIHAHEMPGGCGTSESCRECGACQAILEAQKGASSSRECRLLVRTSEGLEAMEMKVATSPFEFDGTRYTIVSLADVSHEKRRRALERVFFHDLLNTAWVVSGYANLLLSLESQESRDGLDRISMAARRLIEEIRSQRDLVAAEEGELEPAADAVDPVEVAEGIVSQYQASPLARRMTVALAPSTGPRRILTDPVLLGRVLSNMVKNALEATPEGGAVQVGVEEEDGGAGFWVHNPGAIPRDVQLQIFQRSFSTKGEKRGLGTYSMKLLAENFLGGRVGFTSTEAEGTTFRLWLPLVLPERPE